MTLIAHYPLTEDAGSTAFDYSGSNNNGSITGAGPVNTGTVTGPFGETAFDFDGTDDVVDLGDNIDETSFPRTLSAWVKLDVTNSNQVFVSLSTRNYIAYETQGTNGYEYSIRNTSETWLSATSGVTTINEWIHVVGTWDGSTAIVYVNGTKEGTVSVSSTVDATINDAVGAWDGGANGGFTDGKIYDARVYDRVLSKQEIQYLYNSRLRGEVYSVTKNA